MALRELSVIERRNRPAVGFQEWSFFRGDVAVLPRGEPGGPEQGKELYGVICMHTIVLYYKHFMTAIWI